MLTKERVVSIDTTSSHALERVVLIKKAHSLVGGMDFRNKRHSEVSYCRMG